MSPKVPPHDEGMEAGLIGAFLLHADPLHDLIGQLTLNDFWKALHRAIFGVISRLLDAGETIDTRTVRDGLRDQGLLGGREGEAYLVSLEAKGVTAATAATYFAKIREKTLAREAIRVADEVRSVAYERPSEAKAVVGHAIAQFTSLVRPTPSQPEPAPWPEPDPAMFRGLAKTVVDTISPHSEADPVGLLACFMTAFGNAVGFGPSCLGRRPQTPSSAVHGPCGGDRQGP